MQRHRKVREQSKVGSSLSQKGFFLLKKGTELDAGAYRRGIFCSLLYFPLRHDESLRLARGGALKDERRRYLIRIRQARGGPFAVSSEIYSDLPLVNPAEKWGENPCLKQIAIAAKSCFGIMRIDS